MSLRGSRIAGTGLGAPTRIISNHDLAKFVDTSDEWIRTRTGIHQRRILDREKGETHLSISIEAARGALNRAKIDAKEIDLIICCTASPDTWMPISAARIAGELDIRAASFDLNAACTGFVAGVHVANGLIASGIHQNVLVVGTDVFSSMLDWSDRSTCVLFGDGSGAAVVQAVPNADLSSDSMILASQLFTHSDRDEVLAVKGGGSRVPFSDPRFNKEIRPFVNMNGMEVFKAASRGMAEAAVKVCALANVSLEELRWLVPHQANIRILEKVAAMLDFPMEKVYVNVEKWGNTSAGTIGICLSEMEDENLLKKGDLVLLDAFGGGFAYGAVLLRW